MLKRAAARASGSPFGSAAEAVAACEGDDLQYDFNAFAASLAVASAAELGRWEASTDFVVKYGKLELSATGELHCGGCNNIRALLRLQDDASSAVPYHSPSVLRSKLTTWHARQTTELTKLVDKMLTVDKGVFRIKNRASGKYMQVHGGLYTDNALVEQRWAASQPGSDQWRLVLDHTMHKLINVRSGKCLELTQDAGVDNIAIVQRTCSSGALQKFGFATIGDAAYTIRTKTGFALDVKYSSLNDDTPIVQMGWNGSDSSQHWALESVGNTIQPDVIANAMYTIVAKHSGKAIGVDNGSMSDGAGVEQFVYSASDDRFQWFIVASAGAYNVINRKSGKCLDLQYASGTGRVVQRTCSGAGTQFFTPLTSGDGMYVLYSSYGKPLEIEGSSPYNDTLLAQSADGGWNDNRRFTLTPVLAGEPHRLTFSHATNDGPCGKYFWYDIAQPSGLALRSPADSFVQLIFAGGKTTASGSDENPFIAQLVNGNQVAIDPSGYMNPGSTSTSGSCVQTDVLYDAAGTAAGKCCIKYTGATGLLTKSSWSSTTYLCK
ncbi:MAG: RICIN domain-containing protein [Deltaproteobacteria bacterium]